jgi:hypothetical protein
LLTLLTAVLNVLPIFGPFLPPLKGEIASLTDLGREPVLGLCSSGHSKSLGPKNPFAKFVGGFKPRLSEPHPWRYEVACSP